MAELNIKQSDGLVNDNTLVVPVDTTTETDTKVSIEKSYYTPTPLEEFDSLYTYVFIDLFEYIKEHHAVNGFMNTSTPVKFINIIEKNVKFNIKNDGTIEEDTNIESD
jgi:hypothetical protein